MDSSQLAEQRKSEAAQIMEKAAACIMGYLAEADIPGWWDCVDLLVRTATIEDHWEHLNARLISLTPGGEWPEDAPPDDCPREDDDIDRWVVERIRCFGTAFPGRFTVLVIPAVFVRPIIVLEYNHWDHRANSLERVVAGYSPDAILESVRELIGEAMAMSRDIVAGSDDETFGKKGK